MSEKGVENYPESRLSAIFYSWRMDYYFKSPTMKTHGHSMCLDRDWIRTSEQIPILQHIASKYQELTFYF